MDCLLIVDVPYLMFVISSVLCVSGLQGLVTIAMAGLEPLT